MSTPDPKTLRVNGTAMFLITALNKNKLMQFVTQIEAMPVEDDKGAASGGAGPIVVFTQTGGTWAIPPSVVPSASTTGEPPSPLTDWSLLEITYTDDSVMAGIQQLTADPKYVNSIKIAENQKVVATVAATSTEAPAPEAAPTTSIEAPAPAAAPTTSTEAPAPAAAPTTSTKAPTPAAAPTTSTKAPAPAAAPTTSTKAPTPAAAPTTSTEAPAPPSAPEEPVTKEDAPPAAPEEPVTKEDAPPAAPEEPLIKEYAPRERLAASKIPLEVSNRPAAKKTIRRPSVREAPSPIPTSVKVSNVIGDVAPRNMMKSEKGFVAFVSTPDGVKKVTGPTAESVQKVVMAQEAKVEALPAYSVNQGYPATGGKRRTKRVKKMRTKDTKRNFTR